jgi:L-erythro-3,5-diaminohexanoate dehydrogenase
MGVIIMNKGCKYGTHRVIEPKGVLPQAALKICNDMNIFSNEMLIDVQAINIDSASFTQLEKEANGDVEKIKAKILEIVGQRGKNAKSCYRFRRNVNRNYSSNRRRFKG